MDLGLGGVALRLFVRWFGLGFGDISRCCGVLCLVD